MSKRMWGLLVLTVLAISLVGSETHGDQVCPKRLMERINDINRKALSRGGAFAFIAAAECDGGGNVSLLIIQRTGNGNVTRWRPADGPVDLLRQYVGDQPK